MDGSFTYSLRGLMTAVVLLSVHFCVVAQEQWVDTDTAKVECSLPENISAMLEQRMGCGIKLCPLNDPLVAVHSTVIGAGAANVLDTYLSPYNYTGPEIRIVRETGRMTRLCRGRVSNQIMIDANASYLENRSGTAHEWAGGIRYSMGWHYHFKPMGRIQFRGGLLASGYLGGVYNTRNGNNPAQAKLDVAIDVSGTVVYLWNVAHSTVVCRYQLSVPMLGVAFSPNYGQSYYEIFSLGDYDRNAVFAYPGNMPSMRHLLTADIPVGHGATMLRVGYSGQFNQAVFNHLRYHSYSHNFLLGFVKYFRRL
ncbi:MAG: DUF3316 domain-containing protein [Bacteroides sp.]|nr:DUF3316 domain-containing protein [Roseburia sp.]MCM1347633.1 DUF3316 domain-containing protein [Bacteroides sp.]MCM1422034.1 DUF3316 domain-containing protein [Bacteroides sp.]